MGTQDHSELRRGVSSGGEVAARPAHGLLDQRDTAAAANVAEAGRVGGAGPALAVAGLVAGLTLSSIGVYSSVALTVVLVDGMAAAALLASAAGPGLWIVRGLLGAEARRSEQVVLGTVLGAGLTALLMLALGSYGILERGVWSVILAAFAALTATRVVLLARRRPDEAAVEVRPDDAVESSAAWAWLLVVPFLVLASIAACVPPGILWPDEGNGYDVLEYHLAAPKEFLRGGVVSYLPHNIYTNLPLAAEMLYLVCMVLRGDAFEAVYFCQMLNLLLGVLAVAAVWLAARPFGRRAAATAGIAAATCPMVAYLCGIAYTENGLLASGAAALACVLRLPFGLRRPACWGALAGLLAGLAVGFKYTALPMLLAPLGLSCLLALHAPLAARARTAACFVAAAGLAVAPWLVRNAVHTGNPLFPLARGVFPERAGVWTDALAAQWQAGHLPHPDDRSGMGRLRAAVREVVASTWYATLPWLAPVFALLARVRRNVRGSRPGAQAAGDAQRHAQEADGALVCGAVACTIGLVWLTATHLVGRFAVLAIAPLAVLAGMGSAGASRVGSRGATGILVAAAVVNAALMGRLFACGPLFALPEVGQTSWMVSGAWPDYPHLGRLNELLRNGERVLLVADARTFYLDAPPTQYEYCVVFNRNPFAEFAAAHSAEQVLDWLRARRFDVVFVHWGEMARLRASRYGFWPGVDEELFERLMACGLERSEEFHFLQDPHPVSTLFRVPPRR